MSDQVYSMYRFTYMGSNKVIIKILPTKDAKSVGYNQFQLIATSTDVDSLRAFKHWFVQRGNNESVEVLQFMYNMYITSDE